MVTCLTITQKQKTIVTELNKMVYIRKTRLFEYIKNFPTKNKIGFFIWKLSVIGAEMFNIFE